MDTEAAAIRAFGEAFDGDPSGALFLDCRSREREVIPFDPGAARLVVVDTGVSHALSGEASGYNDRVADCRRAADTPDGLLDREVTALRDVTPADLDDHADALDPTVLRRARHVVSENRRVQEAAETPSDRATGGVYASSNSVSPATMCSSTASMSSVSPRPGSSGIVM
jgi:galactokinase